MTPLARLLALLAGSRPLIVGIVNCTPDSFSEGGLCLDPGQAVQHIDRLLAEGADIIDIGGESTRPGAAGVGAEEELRRVMPVFERLAGRPGGELILSIDTSKPEVMRQAVAAGAALINDVRALCTPGAIESAAGLEAAVCVMHMQGTPATMQVAPDYRDVVAEVTSFLRRRIAACEAAGIERRRLIADPGFGFGKTTAHNMQLLAGLPRLAAALGVPLMAGLSRKRSIGELTGRPPAERTIGSAAAALLAVQRGARLVRVHDVAATRDALRVWAAVEAAALPGDEERR